MIAIVVCALVSLGAAWLAGAQWGWASFAILMLALVLSHQRHLHGLTRWLGSEAPDPPRAHGAWDALHARLQRTLREGARREAELALALERWRAVARALPDGVVILDGERIAWCNDRAHAHLGIDPERDVGNSLTHLARIPEFVACLQSGASPGAIEVEVPPSGRVLSLQVVEFGAGQRLVLSRDITQLRRVDTVRREFVADVSHELRTPLTVITGFLEMLKEEADTEAARRHIELMAGQAKRMERLVEDLLSLSALESSPPPSLDEAIDMAALMERLGAEARALSAGRHDIVIAAEPGLDLLGSDKEIASAFGNLMSNAIRYTPQGGSVRLAWRAVADGAEFEAQDSGIGIASEHLSRLTERFYRVDRGRSRESGGTGLGLAIVKHALARHGAALDISSRMGEGSRFTARFSAARVRPASRSGR